MTTVFSDELKLVLADEAECKARETCPRLKIRELFFEPNPGTLGKWQEQRQFYREGIDQRLMFVCESPSQRKDPGSDPDFAVNGQPGWICWNVTSQDARFREMRIRYGLQNCVITNSVKCGLLRPSTPANLTDVEVGSCAGFLRREIEAIHPQIIVCVGDVAHGIVRRHIVSSLSYSVPVVKITHYSHRCSNQELSSRWERELTGVRRNLDLGSPLGDAPEPVIRKARRNASLPTPKSASRSHSGETPSPGAWVLRPYPHHVNRFNEFLTESMIALGWPGVGDLRRFDRASLMARLGEAYPEPKQRRAFGGWIGTLLTFRDSICHGDLVVVAPKVGDSRNVAIARVIGPYEFVAGFDGTDRAYAHRRTVKWLATDVPRSDLPSDVSRGLKQGTLHATGFPALREFCAGRGVED